MNKTIFYLFISFNKDNTNLSNYTLQNMISSYLIYINGNWLVEVTGFDN